MDHNEEQERREMTVARIIEHIGEMSHEDVTILLAAIALSDYLLVDRSSAWESFCLDGDDLEHDEPEDFRLTSGAWDRFIAVHSELLDEWEHNDYVFDVIQSAFSRAVGNLQPKLPIIELN